MNYIFQYRGLKKEIYILFIGRIVTAMGAFIYPMLTLMLRVKLELSPSEIATILAISTALSLPASIIGGRLTDVFGRKKIIVLFDLITVSLFILAGILPFSMMTLVLLFIGGLFAQMEAPAYSALIADFSKTEDREKAYSMSYLGFNLGFMLGPTLGGLMFADYLWLSFILNGVATLCSTILIIFFIHERNSIRNLDGEQLLNNEYEKSAEKEPIWSVIKTRKVVLLVMIAGSLAGAVYSLVGFLLPLNMTALYNEQGAVFYGMVSSFNGFVVIVATPLLTILCRRLREIPKMAIGVLLFTVGLGIFGFTSGLVYSFLAMFVFTVGEVINALGGSPYITRRVPSSHRGRIFAISSIAGTITGIISQLTIGYLLETHTYSFIWLSFIFVGALVILLYAIASKFDRKTFEKLYHL